MLRFSVLCFMSACLSIGLTGCIATKVVTATVGVATKATVLTVKTTGKVARGTADLLASDGDNAEEERGVDGIDENGGGAFGANAEEEVDN